MKLHGVVEKTGVNVDVTLFDEDHGGRHAAMEHALRLARENDCGDEEILRGHLDAWDHFEQGEWGVYLVDATVEQPKLQAYPIVVTVTRAEGVKDEDLDPDDREQHPEGTYTYPIEAVNLRAAKEQALDAFHSSVPIALLENYDIEATSPLDAVASVRTGCAGPDLPGPA